MYSAFGHDVWNILHHISHAPWLRMQAVKYTVRHLMKVTEEALCLFTTVGSSDLFGLNDECELIMDPTLAGPVRELLALGLQPSATQSASHIVLVRDCQCSITGVEQPCFI